MGSRETKSAGFNQRLFFDAFIFDRILRANLTPPSIPCPHRAEPSTDRFPSSDFRPRAFCGENRPAVAARERRYETVSRYTDNPGQVERVWQLLPEFQFHVRPR
jgi:hypothetical protein